MRFEIKTVSGEDLERTLNEYEPYSLEPFTVVPDVHMSDILGEIVTHYKIVYRVVPEEDLQEAR